MGVQKDSWLPYASSLCAACYEVCPVKINIPKLLLDLRSDVVKAKDREGEGRLEKLAFRGFAWVMRHPKIYEMLGLIGATVFPASDERGWIKHVPALMNYGPLQGWLSQRDLPPPASRSFRQEWRLRKGKQ